MPVFGRFPALDSYLSACQTRRWSIIPLIGGSDAHLGKRPACRWQVYTRRLPFSAEIKHWFEGQQTGAYGVVCGPVSGLIVLDLDDPALAERFAAAFPDLLATLVVRSGLRGTPHIYWQVDFPVRTRAFSGGDLKAAGSYVVGPGSTIAGGVWRVLTDRPVRDISRADLDRVLAFLIPSNAVPSPVSKHVDGFDQDYEGLYRFYVQRLHSRNQALFRVACSMRDRGCAEPQAVVRLAQVHAVQPSPVDGRLESFKRRYAEALRTIGSAYSRAPQTRPRSQSAGESVNRLSNAVRETLLKRPDGMAVARTLDAAYLSGFLPNAPVTEAQLCQRLKGIVSRETIRTALAARDADGQPLVRPPDHPPALADIPDGITGQNNAILSAGQKRTRARVYGLPDPESLACRLGVEPRGGDPLTLDDVRSARQYRQALHRALLRRRPGVYSQALLAARLGVSSRSIRRYDADLGIRPQPTYHETPILWRNVERIPQAGDLQRFGMYTGGQFLIDDTGKKWPLKREIAVQLLRQGRRVSHMRQGCSHYQCDAPALPLETAETAVYAAAAPLEITPRRTPDRLVAEQTAAHTPPTGFPAAAPARASRPDFAREGASRRLEASTGVVSHKKRVPRHFRRPVPDAAVERTAQQIHARVPGLSLPNARRLVTTYGCDPAAAALRKFGWLSSRSQAASPAGLFVTLMRVSWRAHQTASGPGLPEPRFQAEPARRSRAERYVHPKDDPLWQSAAYRDWRAGFFGLDDPLLEPTVEELAF